MPLYDVTVHIHRQVQATCEQDAKNKFWSEMDLSRSTGVHMMEDNMLVRMAEDTYSDEAREMVALRELLHKYSMENKLSTNDKICIKAQIETIWCNLLDDDSPFTPDHIMDEEFAQCPRVDELILLASDWTHDKRCQKPSDYWHNIIRERQ